MQAEPTALPDVRLIRTRRFGDERGFFAETWNQRGFAEAGLDFPFVQDNESLSRDAGTLRGLHYQAPPYAQTKLVRVVAGSVLDVAVDVRVGSPHFGQSVAFLLSAENGHQLLVPRGFLHGFLTLESATHVIYKVDNFYNAEADGAVIWNDPDIAIKWGIDPDSVILSAKDAVAPRLADWQSPFVYEGAA
ncbi:MAG: dTDP-4-dehydrorhamnose 3,5-epimerase [Rhodobacteraceae bacterium]|nr:dTDP-4-dehydrorhamnose 3,5-epimerase [Paracoccaceae bacterium]